MYFEELLKKVSEPADLAVFLLGFATGFVVGPLLFTGIPPGTAAGVAAIGLLGLKKGTDAYVSGANWVRKRQTRRRLRIIREYFSDNPEAIKAINILTDILDAQLVNYTDFNLLLDEKLKKYIDYTLEKPDDFKDRYEGLLKDSKQKYENLLEDFEKLLSLAQHPQENNDELRELWSELNTKYHPPRPPRRVRRSAVDLLDIPDLPTG